MKIRNNKYPPVPSDWKKGEEQWKKYIDNLKDMPCYWGGGLESYIDYNRTDKPLCCMIRYKGKVWSGRNPPIINELWKNIKCFILSIMILFFIFCLVYIGF